MKPFVKGLVLAGVHVALVSSLGAKLLIDRARLPRMWLRVAPYDPNLPIRGRYVRLRIFLPQEKIAVPLETGEPIAFFIPEHVPDPSRRPPDEELWAEVTVPRRGPPRPIRLGVKKNGVLTPLPLE